MKIIFLLATILLATPAIAEPHECRTRKPILESRFDALCPYVRQVHPRPVPWDEDKCATWLFEYGMAVFHERNSLRQLNEANRIERERLEAEIRSEFADATPTPTISPTISPTVTPTPEP